MEIYLLSKFSEEIVVIKNKLLYKTLKVIIKIE